MKNKLISVVFIATMIISSACGKTEVITDPCDPEFIGPPEAGQCE